MRFAPRGTLALVTLAGLWLAAASRADFVSITFDDLGNGNVITNQYAGQGLTIAAIPPFVFVGPYVTEDPIYGVGNKLLSSHLNGNAADLDLKFVPDVDYFALQILDTDEPFSISGYYQGNLVSTQSFSPNGDNGQYFAEFGAIGGSDRFDQFVIDLVNVPGQTGNEAGPEYFDNIVYNTVPRVADVPEPTSIVTGLIGAFSCLGYTLRRRFGKTVKKEEVA